MMLSWWSKIVFEKSHVALSQKSDVGGVPTAFSYNSYWMDVETIEKLTLLKYLVGHFSVSV